MQTLFKFHGRALCQNMKFKNCSDLIQTMLKRSGYNFWSKFVYSYFFFAKWFRNYVTFKNVFFQNGHFNQFFVKFDESYFLKYDVGNFIFFAKSPQFYRLQKASKYFLLSDAPFYTFFFTYVKKVPFLGFF